MLYFKKDAKFWIATKLFNVFKNCFLEWERAFISLVGKTRELLKMAYTHLEQEDISGSIWIFN